jgi:hypothetical protein
LQLLPRALLECILDELLLHMHEDGRLPANPLAQLYCTHRASRTAMLEWQRHEEGAPGQAWIGAADIRMAADDKDGLGALKTLTRWFPRYDRVTYCNIKHLRLPLGDPLALTLLSGWLLCAGCTSGG